MHAHHIHITGLVQGVGFRPHVHKLAVQMGIHGWVSNGADGVHIICKAAEEKIQAFYHSLVLRPPVQAKITGHHIHTVHAIVPDYFFIRESDPSGGESGMLLTPDMAMCDDCRREIKDPLNRRWQYPFTTCVNCGPRYSITTALPYDRENTTMRNLEQCPACKKEYANVMDHRHHSQTNSCPDCSIRMFLYHASGTQVEPQAGHVTDILVKLLRNGKIIAVKNTGGYLLICDASNAPVITLLRERKQRPRKPFALLYADLEMLYADTGLLPQEVAMLKDRSAPIVLCHLKKQPENAIAVEQIAPGLSTIGAMLPSTPLLQLIAERFGKPLVATSANLSGSPIIYEDAQALYWLREIADYILTYERDIIAPQDDSVLQFSRRGQKIILRRSRGLAPNYYPMPFQPLPDGVLAMGAELKSAFAIVHHKNLFISQYLGDQESVEAQQSYDTALAHVSGLLGFAPKHILVDKHPRYHVSQRGKELAEKHRCSITAIQHHEAHFAAVLAENDLLQQKMPVLGFIWDGAGFGNDGQVWGSEIFLYDQDEMERVAHLAYFPQLLGDKMNREPRLSALSILGTSKILQHFKHHFSSSEWQLYTKLIQQPQSLQTCSMGRLIDAVACLLGIVSVSSYEGEAAMQLEALAAKCNYHSYDYYSIPFTEGVLDWHQLFSEIYEDWQHKEPNEVIAWKFFYSLAKLVARISSHFDVDRLTFSGGVFQNALLVDMIMEQLQHKRQLYFHKQVSPNDECISLGQLAWYARFGNRPVVTKAEQKIKTDRILSPLLEVY